MQRLASIIVSTYIAIVLYSNLFFIERLVVLDTGTGIFWNNLAILLALVVAVQFIIGRIISLSFVRGAMGPLRILLFSIAFLGLIISIFYHVIPIDAVYTLPTQMDAFFASDLMFSIWLLVPILVLLI